MYTFSLIYTSCNTEVALQKTVSGRKIFVDGRKPTDQSETSTSQIKPITEHLLFKYRPLDGGRVQSIKRTTDGDLLFTFSIEYFI